MAAKNRKPAAEIPVRVDPKHPDPSPAEVAAIRTARARMAERPARAGLKVDQAAGKVVKIANPHTDFDGWVVHLRDTCGSSSRDFSTVVIDQLGSAAGDGQGSVTQARFNAALALLAAVGPQDELEAAIGVQIVAAHFVSLDFMVRAKANAGEYRDTAIAYTNAATKLARTMIAGVEALTKLRSGGKQTHEIRHVHVNGPAVFGDNPQAVIHAGGGRVPGSNLGQSHGPPVLAGPEVAPGVPMLGQDAARDALPIASSARPEKVSDARGPSGRSDRKSERPLPDGATHPRAARG